MKNIFFTIIKKFVILILVVISLTGCQHKNTAVIFIPIITEEIPIGFILSGVHPRGIEVSVTGTELAIKNLSDIKLEYRIDLSQASEGVTSFHINKNLIKLPQDISIVKINPLILSVQMNKKVVKALPIEVVTIGEPADNFILIRTAIKPVSVFAYGPANIIEKYKKIPTKPVDISGLTKSIEKVVALELPKSVSIKSEGETFNATIYIEEKIISKEFQNIKVKVKNTSLSYELKPSLVNIRIKGSISALEKLTMNDIEVNIDLMRLKSGVYTQRAEITLPVNIVFISAEPEIFKVTLRK